MSDQFTRQAVATSLRTMFEGSHFSICKVDAALTALKIVPIKAQYDALRVLHCVDFSTMTAAFREELILRTMALFADGSSCDLSVIERGFLGQHAPDLGRVVASIASPAQKRGFLGLVSNR